MDRGTQSAGQRTHRTPVRHAAGPPGKRNAPSGDRQHGRGQSLFGNTLYSAVGTALQRSTSQSPQCPSTVGWRAAPRGNPQRARGTHGGRRSHRQLGWQSLGRATRRSLRGSSRCAGGNRATTGWLALATLPRPLSPPTLLPSTPAIFRKPFRPTASRTCGTTETQKQNQTQIPCACPAPLEETVEPDISILRKSGHFYFALTRFASFGLATIFIPLLKLTWQFKLNVHLGNVTLCDLPTPAWAHKFSIPYTIIVIALISVDNKFSLHKSLIVTA